MNMKVFRAYENIINYGACMGGVRRDVSVLQKYLLYQDFLRAHLEYHDSKNYFHEDKLHEKNFCIPIVNYVIQE